MPTHADMFEDFCVLVRSFGRDDSQDDAEQLLFDANVEGRRYLLFRMPAPEKKPPALSPREMEVARLVAQGLPNKVIAAVLEISTWTVGTHVRRLFAKLGVNSRAAMVSRLSGYVLPGEPTFTSGPSRTPSLRPPEPASLRDDENKGKLGRLGGLDRLGAVTRRVS